MTIKYGQDLYQCGRYQAAGCEARCSKNEIWTPAASEVPESIFVPYRFDASISGPTAIPTGDWTDIANAFDGSLTTFANTDAITKSSGRTQKRLEAQGFSDEILVGPIKSVRGRFYTLVGGGVNPIMTAKFRYGTTLAEVAVERNTAPTWSEYVDIPPPDVVWTPESVKYLEVWLYAYDAGKNPFATDVNVYAVDIEVEYSASWVENPASNETWSQTDPRA